MYSNLKSRLTFLPKNNWLYSICIISSLVVGIVFVLLRVGFAGNPTIDVLKCFSILLYLLAFPFFKNLYFQKKKLNPPFFLTDSLMLLIGIFSLIIINKIAIFINFPLYCLVCLVAVCFLFFFLFAEVISGNGNRIRNFILFSLLGMFFCINSWAYILNNPLYYEMVILGEGADDNLFFSAINNMLLAYNTPSTGLDGLVFLHYHWFSYFIFGEIINLVNTNSLTFMNMYFPMLFLPLFTFCFFDAVKNIKVAINKPFSFSIISLLIFMIFFTEGICSFLNIRTYIDTYILTSPSYLVALLLCFVAISCFVKYSEFLKQNKKENSQSLFFCFFLIPMFSLLLTFTKVSFLPFWLAIIVWFIFRCKEKRILHLISFLVTFVLIAYFFTNFMKDGSKINHFIPFETFKTRFDLPYLFPFVYYLWFWPSVFFSISYLRSKKWNPLKADTSFIAVESLIILHLLGSIILIFVYFDLNTRFFTDVPRWIALLLLISFFPSLILSEIKEIWKKSFRNKILLSTVFLFISFITVTHITSFTMEWKRVIVKNVNIRKQILNSNSDKKASFSFTSFLKTSELTKCQTALEAHPDYRLIQLFDSLHNAIPVSHRKNYCIYIPYSNTKFWNKQYRVDSSLPFIVPAISGLCAINCLPEKESANNYGYNEYNLEQRRDDLSLPELKARAKMWGFTKIILIPQENNRIKIREIDVSNL